jgi:hypothetical protein
MAETRTPAGETLPSRAKTLSFSYGREYDFQLGRELGVQNELDYSRFFGVDQSIKGSINLIPPFRSRLLDLSVKAKTSKADKLRAGVNVSLGYNLGSAKVSAGGSLDLSYNGQQLSISGSRIDGAFESTLPRAYVKVDPEFSLALNPAISYDVDPIGGKRWQGKKSLPLNIPDFLDPIIDLDTGAGADQKISSSANGLSYSAALPNADTFDLSGGSIDPVTGSISTSFDASSRLLDASFDVAKLSPIPLSAEARFGNKYFAAGGKIIGLEGNLGTAVDLNLAGNASADVGFDIVTEGGQRISFEPGDALSLNGAKDVNGDGYLTGSITGRVALKLNASAGITPSLTASLKAFGASGYLSFEGATILGRKIKGKRVSGGIAPKTLLSASLPSERIDLFSPVSKTIAYDLISQPFFIDVESYEIGLGKVPL